MRAGSTILRSLCDYLFAVIAWTLLSFLAGQGLRSWNDHETSAAMRRGTDEIAQATGSSAPSPQPTRETARESRSAPPFRALELVWLAGLMGISLSSYLLWQRGRQISQAESRSRLQYDLADAVNASMDLDVVLQKCLRTCLDVAQFDCGSLHLVGPDGALVLAAQEGLPDATLTAIARFAPGSLRWQLAMRGDPLFACQEQEEVALLAATAGRMPRGMAVLPVRHQDRVIACLTLSSWTRAKVPNANRLTLESIVTTIGSVFARVRAEHEARRRQVDYEVLFDASPDLEFVVDKDGVILHANRTATNVLGFAADTLQGMRMNDLREEKMERNRFTAVASGPSEPAASCTVSLLMADGSRLPVEIRVIEGSWFGCAVSVHVARDIREQRRHEQLLSTERDLVLALTDATSAEEIVGLCLDAVEHVTGLDTTGIWLPRSADQAQLIGGRGELLAVHGDVIGGAGQTELLRTLQAETHTRRVSDSEQWIWHGTFGNRIASVFTFPVRTDDSWLATLVVATDSVAPLPDWISRALQAIVVYLRLALVRRSITERLRKLNRAIEQSSSTVVITNAQGVVEYVNPRFEETSGYRAAEAIGKLPSILSSGQQQREFYEELWKTLNTRRDWRGEFHNRRKDGSLYWESATISPICDKQGRITHFVAVKEDITDRKRAEEELRRSSETLAEHVKALETANQALQEMNRIAQSATRSKSEFLANMSHEIRTPMTAILGFADVLANTPVSPEQEDAIGTIRRNGEHLLSLINEILDLSKIEAGKLDIEAISVDPVAIVDEVVDLMRLRAELKHLPLELKFGGLMPASMVTDPTRLRQILVNLVGNAIKFTDIGRVCVHVRTIGQSGQPAILEIQVTDSGPGMSEQQLARLFQPFQQADASTARQYGGTGLGLAISRRLAELMGGHITVTSSPNLGSTFVLSIPVGTVTGVPMRHVESQMVARSSGKWNARSQNCESLACRVLLAEDGPDNLRLIRHWLYSAGAHVEVVENGRDAVERVMAASGGACALPGQPAANEFDVIVMDMQMPVLDGYAATRRLRELGYSQPIIALTAHAMKDDERKCLDAGCDYYLSKPVDRQRLISVIAGLIGVGTGAGVLCSSAQGGPP